jgi:3-oxoacyl-[acyl-carrier-protein] synthase II
MRPILTKLLQDEPVYVTGMGAVTAAGLSAADLWQKARTATVSAQWGAFEFGGETFRRAVSIAPAFEEQIGRFPRARKMDRAAQMALAAANQAIEQAGLADGGIPPDGSGVCLGTSRGPVEKRMLSGDSANAGRILPSFAANGTIGSFSGAIAQFFSLFGPSLTVSATCSSGAVAIAVGAEQILLGLADVMVVGGTDATLHPLIMAQLNAAGVLGTHEDPLKTCRPFDRTRDGICLGEGAGVLILESARSVQRRGAKPLGRLAGWATGVENAGRAGVGQGGEMLAYTINRALATAALTPDRIDYINVHGTGTIVNDAAEAAAVRKAFSDLAAPPPCSSTKPITGHCLGATPAMEAIVCLQALQHQEIPPTANCLDQDPACSIDVVPLQARQARLKTVMSTSLGFWGSHAALIFSTAG